MGSHASNGTARFAGFALGLRTGELVKNGRRVRLQAQPLKALRILLEHPGELVTREQLQKEVWPEDTFVDFDHGLNKAIAKLRDAVDEPGASQSMIETLPRLGYRFILVSRDQSHEAQESTSCNRASGLDRCASQAQILPAEGGVSQLGHCGCGTRRRLPPASSPVVGKAARTRCSPMSRATVADYAD